MYIKSLQLIVCYNISCIAGLAEDNGRPRQDFTFLRLFTAGFYILHSVQDFLLRYFTFFGTFHYSILHFTGLFTTEFYIFRDFSQFLEY